MRCKVCDYPLWQLASRTCPECGTAFKPSDYEFTLNSVRFCCPHCEQAYYGTGPKGHLVPRSFACVGCAKTIDMDDMVLRPTEGVSETQTQVTVVPWIERRTRGWFTSFFITMGMAITNPRRTIDAVPESSTAWRAFWYMAIQIALQTVLSGAPFLLAIFIPIIVFASKSSAWVPLGFAGAFVLCIAVLPIAVVIAALIVHVVLRITGPTAAGFGRTMHAVCYSAGNNFLAAVPCLGAYFLWIPALLWWSISGGFMLARAQKVRGWRAGVAAGTPVLLIIALIVGGIFAAVYGFQRSIATTMASLPGMKSIAASTSSAADRMAAILNGVGISGQQMNLPRPSHPAETLLRFQAQPAEFILPGSASDTRRCRIQDEPLNKYQIAFANQGELRTKLAADPRAGTSACRVGDFVFTYGDLPSRAGGDLWLAIGWPDPEMNPSDPAEVAIVKPDGVAEVVKAADFDALLADQNAVRAKAGLSAIPHPRTVTATNSTPPPAATPPAPVWNGMYNANADQTRVETLTTAILAAPHPLRHIGQLLLKDEIRADDLVSFELADPAAKAARMSHAKIGHRTLQQLDTDPEMIKQAALDRALKDFPANAVAYRVGDTVFTHLGMNLDDPKVRASGLWIVIGDPLTRRSGQQSTLSSVVGMANGQTRVFSNAQLATELIIQNRLRQSFGLAPLPAPSGIPDDGAVGPASQAPGSSGEHPVESKGP